MLDHGLHPLKAQRRRSIETFHSVRPEGRTPKLLTQKTVESAEATGARQERPDGRGLYLIIQPLPSGAKSWHGAA
jgi:hypothetical protein